MKKKQIYKWPQSLPKAYYNFSYNPIGSFARTQMQSGVARHRFMDEGTNLNVVVEFKIPRDKQDDFLFFIHKIIGEDCSWGFFEMPLIFGDKEENYQVRFTNAEAPYKTVNNSNKLWHITAEFEIIGFDFMKESDFFERNPDVFETAIDSLDVIINEDMPEYFKEK